MNFHGEVSTIPWMLDNATRERADLHVELFSVPVVIVRVLELDGRGVRITDTLSNTGGSRIEFDYASHPALGGNFLSGECRIDTGARHFVSDPESASTPFVPGSRHSWPIARDRWGNQVDLRVIPAPPEQREVFGWLENFSSPWAAVTNVDLGIAVRLDWDGKYLPYAWLWQELNATDRFPWYQRARTLAVEPSSTPTSGPQRRTTLSIDPGRSIQVWVRCGFEGP
ncbi:MAG: hypothetical protein M3Y49_04560 [Actinomycetota bacterium]|nr:hypothetical protein [Actinomycetota bacterium]